jgi:hypothetical protein
MTQQNSIWERNAIGPGTFSTTKWISDKVEYAGAVDAGMDTRRGMPLQALEMTRGAFVRSTCASIVCLRSRCHPPNCGPARMTGTVQQQGSARAITSLANPDHLWDASSVWQVELSDLRWLADCGITARKAA